MSNGNTGTFPSFGTPPPAYNIPQPDYGYLNWANQGYPSYNNQMYMPSMGGGGGWVNDMATLGGTGMMVGGPVGAAVGAGLGLLGGIFGGIAKGKKRKEARKALEGGQRAYQAKAEQLFPELSKASFQYQNPQMSNAINAGLSYMMGNMFGKWGMPPGMNQGYGNMAQFFQGLMPGVPPVAQPAPQQPPMGQGGFGGGGGMGSAGQPGWYDNFKNQRGMTAPRQFLAR